MQKWNLGWCGSHMSIDSHRAGAAAALQVQGHPELHAKILAQKNKRHKNLESSLTHVALWAQHHFEARFV